MSILVSRELLAFLCVPTNILLPVWLALVRSGHAVTRTFVQRACHTGFIHLVVTY